jgi:hypothetical protein
MNTGGSLGFVVVVVVVVVVVAKNIKQLGAVVVRY